MNNIILAISLSGFLHVGVSGALYHWLSSAKETYIVTELDLSVAPLIPQISRPAGGSSGRPAAPKKWTVPSEKTPQPSPELTHEALEDVLDQEESAPDIDTGDIGNESDGVHSGTGLTGDGSGVGLAGYRSLSGLSQKPRWVRNFIRAQDYPLLARKEGKDGVVTLEIFINSRGYVDDVKLVHGPYEILNQVALRKVRQARFRPAYDENGRAVACRVTLPIRFRLK